MSVSFPRTFRELYASDPYLTSGMCRMPGSIPTDKASGTPSTFITTWQKVLNVLCNEMGQYYTILDSFIQVLFRSRTTANRRRTSATVPIPAAILKPSATMQR